MNKKAYINNLIGFIKKSSCSFTCVEEIKRVLKKEGYKELKENSKWNLNGKKYYTVRNDASIIAFEIPQNLNSAFSIITTHLDTPALLLKPCGNYIKENYLKHNIMPYGGLLNYGWLDHPLSLAGRIIINNKGNLEKKIVDFKNECLIIPSVAIHQNDSANSNLDLNMQVDLQPIISLSKDKNTWNKLLRKKINGNIVDYDLYAYNPYNPILIGNNKELLVSPRIDNIVSVYSSLQSFLDTKSNNIKIFCSFNTEEIGSLTIDGADSNFLLDVLKRIAANLDIDLVSSLDNSFIISSDNTHAIHPNHPEYCDDTGKIYLGKGFAIIKEENSTTNSMSSSIIKTMCDKYKIKYQDSTAKNDLSGGSTLSGISLRHVSVLSIDVGIGQLSMHSSIEVCSINDAYELYKMMNAFYKTKIKKDNSIIKII